MVNIRPGYVCFEIAFGDPYLRIIEDMHLQGEIRTVQISSSRIIEYSICSQTSSRGIMVFCEKSSFMKTFGLDIAKVQERSRSIFMSALGSFDTLRIPLFSDIAADIDEILCCEYPDPLKTIFIRSKVIQILCGLVSQINEYGAGPRLFLPQGFKVRTIETAAKIYRRELRNPPSIEELARRVGMDRRELTKGFQELFGMTPRGYQLQSRMEQAELLLREGGKSISEVGRIVGYQGYRTFARAYETFYGYPPASRLERNKGL